MSAVMDRTGKPYFIPGGQPRISGAAPASHPCLPEFETERPSWGEPTSGPGPDARHRTEKTWLICRHLCPSYNFIDSYLRFRYFIIRDSRVICHHCHRERARTETAGADLTRWDGLALTDRQLQDHVFAPLYRVNFDLGEKPAGLSRDQIATWYACKHLSGWTNLRQYIFSRRNIYFAENNVICSDCLDTFVQGCQEKFDQGLILMRDSELQQTVIDNLYLINYEFSLIHGFVDDSALV
jgi:hypothetical protein